MLYGWELLNPDEEEIVVKGVKKGKALGGPYHLSLFPTNRCNLRCFFCYAKDQTHTAEELEWPLLQKALEDGKKMGVKGCSFGGGGEPLIYPQFRNILDFMEKNQWRADSLKSNGTAMTEEIARRLMGLHLERVTVSLNETEPDTYAAMGQCEPRLYDRAMAGIHHLVEAKRAAKSSCEISVQVFIWKENYGRLPQMIEKLLDTGLDLIYLNTIDGLPNSQKFNPVQREEVQEILGEVMAKWASRLETNFSAEGLQDFVKTLQHRHCPERIEMPDICQVDHRIEYCYIGWYAPTLDARGDLFPCCHFSTTPSKSLGNLHEKSLPEIWHGPDARQYRQEMRHLLLTSANAELLPRKTRFIMPLCMGRSDCAFNFYLCHPRVYHAIHDWAEKGPRQVYTQKARLKKKSWNALRGIKNTLTGKNR